eukprot:CAMPEP_0182459336 /NCGR_PEP_ID=MMETSP1319-20130603/4488_1 /TAXON_ID=172717 /ORGANISM="Bolidomonas pacifica, Strain RCC208" /LENGTH=50 /DNA_ID=CAMNT_0024658229 /DNA_START=27 /DNA_END=176 /DNA_ORIENTATION=-
MGMALPKQAMSYGDRGKITGGLPALSWAVMVLPKQAMSYGDRGKITGGLP